MLQFLDFPFGGACVIVPPSLGILGRFTTGLSSSLPGDITADRDQEAIEHVREICTGRRLDLVRLGTGKVIDEVENCLGKKTS